MLQDSTAVKKRIVMAIFGPTNVGKTHFGLKAPRPVVLDFGNSTTFFGGRQDFERFTVDHVDTDQEIEKQVAAFVGAVKKRINEFDTCVVDDFSKAWDAICDQHARAKGRPVQFGDWKDLRPIHRRIINQLLSLPLHLIFINREQDSYEMANRQVKSTGEELRGERDFAYEHDIIIQLQEENNTRFGIVHKADRAGVFRVGNQIKNPTFAGVMEALGQGNTQAPHPESAPEQSGAGEQSEAQQSTDEPNTNFTPTAWETVCRMLGHQVFEKESQGWMVRARNVNSQIDAQRFVEQVETEYEKRVAKQATQ